ncbi:DUF1616 domain-containing protein [Halobaculum lipolyticum]|uniref:DUF1616 domain-containing protein n=1 Tax=Halobaculum lipolyticum TaxID=3032001 RepID=A0ABD5WDH3_9EURY|nr:DUF1616 domain-containing protein [Halobaculum sp. DT31]
MSRGHTRTVEVAVLVGCVLLALASVGYAVSGPASGTPYTEFSVLSPDGERLVADDYPTVGDDDGTVVVRTTNHEREQRAYTLVATAERVTVGAGAGDDDAPTVRERRELARETLLLADGETAAVRVDVLALGAMADAPNVRVVFSLYRGDASPGADGTDAYRSLHLWVNATDVGGG